MLSILSISMCLGTVSKALLMSIAAMRDLSAGLGPFNPSRIVWVMLVSSVVVEC